MDLQRAGGCYRQWFRKTLSVRFRDGFLEELLGICLTPTGRLSVSAISKTLDQWCLSSHLVWQFLLFVWSAFF